MEYYTTIICMCARPKDRPMNSKDWETESEIISEVDSHSNISNLSEENDPLKEVSLAHRDWIIEVEGRGGDQEDLWRRRYLNGQYEHIVPVWPEYEKIIDRKELNKKQEEKDMALVKDLNDILEQTNASWRVVYREGRFFVNNDIEFGDDLLYDFIFKVNTSKLKTNPTVLDGNDVLEIYKRVRDYGI